MRKVLLSFTFLFLFALGATMTQTGCKPISNNLIINSTFDIGIQNWTVNNPISDNLGWCRESFFAYGTTSRINNGPRIFTTTPSAMNPCVGYLRQIRSSPAGLLKRLS
jgi:hypothetical protein